MTEKFDKNSIERLDDYIQLGEAAKLASWTRQWVHRLAREGHYDSVKKLGYEGGYVISEAEFRAKHPERFPEGTENPFTKEKVTAEQAALWQAQKDEAARRLETPEAPVVDTPHPEPVEPQEDLDSLLRDIPPAE